MIRCLFLALIVFLSGGVGFSNARVSQSQIDGFARRYEKYVGDMYVLQHVDLHVQPANSKSKNIMIFPVPLYEPERKSAGGTFSFWISIISKQAGQALVPQDFAYVSPTGGRWGPRSMIGPFDCRSQQRRPAPVHAPLQTFPIAEGRCYTMLVEFQAPEPDPSERFSFVPGSLQSGQRKDALPTINFSESTRNNTVAVP